MKAIYMVLLAMVFLIPLASGLEFDNVKSYDKPNQEYTITNAFGLGKEIGKVKLNTPVLFDVFDRGEGIKQLVGEITISSNGDYENALKQIELFDIRQSKKEMNREVEYRLKEFYEEELEDWATDCADMGVRINLSICNYTLIGTHNVTRHIFVDFNERKDLAKEEITLGIFLDVERGDKGDWIPTIFGEELEEFAVWQETFNTQLTYYWDMNQSSAPLRETINGSNNITFNGAVTAGDLGLIGDAPNITGSSQNLVLPGAYNYINRNQDFSAVWWMKTADCTSGNQRFLMVQDNAQMAFAMNSVGAGNFWMDGWFAPGIDFCESEGTWGMVGLAYDDGAHNMEIYWNGAKVHDRSFDQDGDWLDCNWFGSACDGAENWEGQIDEHALWTYRILNASVMSDLYNSGSGMTYKNVFTELSLVYPQNTTYSNVITELNYTQAGFAHCWATTDGGATNTSIVTAGVNFAGLSSVGGDNTWTVSCNTTANVISEASVTFFVDVGVETFLKSPADALSTTDTTIEFEVNASASGVARLRNQTIYLYYSNSTLLVTNYSTISGLTSSRKFNYTFADGSYIWNAITEANSSSIFLNDWDTNRTFTVDSTAPIITITYPTTAIDFFKVNNNLRINWTVSDVTAGLDTCWLEYQSVNTTVTCNNNGTLINITNSEDKSATFYANDTLGNQNSNSFNWSYKVFWNSETFNTTVYESQTQTYILNMSSTGDEAVTANFSFNGINYTTTKEGTNTQMNFTFSHDLPIGVGTFNFSWNVFYGSDIITTTPEQSQTVDLLNLSICGLGGLNTPFINFTAKDEVTDLPLDFTVDIADWTYYYLGAGDVSKTYSYVDVSANISSHAFCATPNLTIQQSLEVKYSDFIGDYPLRTYQTLEPISNTTTNTVLYLLKTTDGEDITLQVVSPSGVPIDGVYVNVSRTISGNVVLLGSGLTGSDGGINFFLNPDFFHTFTFVKSGYDTLVTSFQPKDSTITLGAAITGNQTYDFLRGISWAIKPLDSTLDNETHYIFNYSFANSGYWVVDEWGFVLTNNSGFVLGSNSSTATGGGNLNVNVTTGNNSYILMNYYWNIGGNYSNATKIWGVLDQTPKGTISGFINLLKLYTSDCVNCTADETSLFGLTLWGRTLLIFFAIFILTGTLAYTSGIYSPTAIAAFASGWITLFDMGLGLLPLLPNSLAVHGVYSIISWMVVLMIGYREAMR